MSAWTNFLLNPEKINWLFLNAEELLDNVELHEIQLHRGGPRVTLRFDIATYPDMPPEKWEIQKFSRVQIKLTLLGIMEASILGWITGDTIDLSIKKVENHIFLSGANKHIALNFRVEFMSIDEISAYQRMV